MPDRRTAQRRRVLGLVAVPEVLASQLYRPSAAGDYIANATPDAQPPFTHWDEVSKGATQMEPVVLAHDRDAMVARYMASEPSAARHVAAVVMGRPGVVLTFYLETIDLSRADLEAVGRPLLNSVVLK